MDSIILNAIAALRKAASNAALVTVIATRGSTPRKAGSQMLVCPDGRIIGTIGGGCAEAEVKMQALRALDENKPVIYHLSLLNDVAADEGMVCGGTMEVFIQVI